MPALGAAVASKLLPGGKVVGEAAPETAKVPPEVEGLNRKAEQMERFTQHKTDFKNPLPLLAQYTSPPNKDAENKYVLDFFRSIPSLGDTADTLQRHLDKPRLNRKEMTEVVGSLTDAYGTIRESLHWMPSWGATDAELKRAEIALAAGPENINPGKILQGLPHLASRKNFWEDTLGLDMPEWGRKLSDARLDAEWGTTPMGTGK